ncbi:MAG: permease-like cell division protein FtsX [Bacteroidota bacterium]|nr:permease-like cell division protein FtsX [Bacteroidota bacterium]MDQ6890136.1 permease-like cell division protein FtsX [Bacteroidota bacterium]
MAQFGKASTKRGKPSYVYAIIGVSLVLFLFGVVGWIFLNIKKTGDYFKESIQLHAYIYRTASEKQIDTVKNYIESLPYAVHVEYTTREKALEKYNQENDTLWKKLAISNPLPESIDFNVRATYMDKDSLARLETYLLNTYPTIISEFQTPKETVAGVSQFVKNTTVVLLIVAIILSIFVIISIDNTIRLAMYSNRFLIKTMQMVGATRWFIAKPLDGRAIINGLIASGIAIALMAGFITLSEKYLPYLKVLHDSGNMLFIFACIITLGLFITLFSTHRSVLKYLKMKLDELY